jgi:predicted ATPase/DNA-binding SARP family transcriptional activator
MARLAISLLGPFQVMLNGESVHHFKTNKARALLTFLAAQCDRAHARETLAEMFWPNRPHGKALANLRHTLAGLRKTIDDANASPAFLLTTRQSIRLNPEAAITVDLAQLNELAATKAMNPDECRNAVALYRGPFLEGFSLDGSPEFEAWMVVTRERIDRSMMQVLGVLVVESSRNGYYGEAIEWAETQLTVEPWNEEAHRQLIWLLACNGQHSVALQQFEHCRTMLADEFDVEPQPGTLALIELIRSGAELPAEMPDFTARAIPAMTKKPAVAISGVPGVQGPLLGREAELDRLDRRLRDPACRLLTIVGVGGVGKTRLAITVAERCTHRYRDGVCFVPLVAVEQEELLANAILQALHAQVVGAVDPPQQLSRYLADKEILLVLDNFEQLVESSSYLATLIESTPRLDILVTSRERLNLSIEWLLPLEGLETPNDDWMTAPQRSLDSYAAVRLFIERIRQLQPSPAQDDKAVGQIGHICRLLDGLPLAIELAAAWTRLLTLDEMIEQLTQGIDLLATTQRDVPARHRTMRAVFDHSWQLLPNQARVALAQLSVFRGGFSREGAKVVAGATLYDLSKLLDSSWLRKRSDGRYDMHELVRQYCESRLIEESGKGGLPIAEATYHRHCTFYGAFMERTSRRMNIRIESMTEIHAEFDNLQAAWRWAINHEQMDIALNVVFSIWFYLHMAGRYRFGLRLMEDYAVQVQSLFARSEFGSQRHQSAGFVLAWLEHGIGNFTRDLGLLEHTRSSVHSYRSILGQLKQDDRSAELSLLLNAITASLNYYEGRLQTVIRQSPRTIQQIESADLTFSMMGKELGERFWTADSYNLLARATSRLGCYVRSIDNYVKSLEQRRAAGEQRFSAHMQTQVALLAWTLGENRIAEQLACDAVNSSQILGDTIGVGLGYRALGRAELATSKYQSAHTHLEAGRDLGQQFGHHYLAMDSLKWLGHLALILGETSQAIAYANEALKAFESLQTAHSNYMAGVWLLLGRVALARQQDEDAEQFFLKTMHARGRAGWEAMDALVGLAEVHARCGDTARASKMLTTVVNAAATADVTRRHVTRFVAVRGLPVETSHRTQIQLTETRQSIQWLAEQLMA